MKAFSKYLPSIISILALVAGTFAQPVQEAIAAHPNVALALGGVYSILSHLLPSPLKK